MLLLTATTQSSARAWKHSYMPSSQCMMEYFPCMVLFANGEQHDCVYVADAKSYIRAWGVWPDDDPGKREIAIQDMAQIQPSPNRLPARFAREMYAVGESGLGYCISRFAFRMTHSRPTALETSLIFRSFPQASHSAMWSRSWQMKAELSRH